MDCWNLKKKNGRPTKVPCSSAGGAAGTDEKYRDVWVTYDEAAAAAKRNKNSGVGFVIPKGYFFPDIDHVDMESPWLQARLDRFSSYTEYSQSGTGIHIYGRCDFEALPTREADGRLEIEDTKYYVKHPSNGMELYIGGLTNRFAVFTGNAVRDVPRSQTAPKPCWRPSGRICCVSKRLRNTRMGTAECSAWSRVFRSRRTVRSS